MYPLIKYTLEQAVHIYDIQLSFLRPATMIWAALGISHFCYSYLTSIALKEVSGQTVLKSMRNLQNSKLDNQIK